jgi:hypothetical protein
MTTTNSDFVRLHALFREGLDIAMRLERRIIELEAENARLVRERDDANDRLFEAQLPVPMEVV